MICITTIPFLLKPSAKIKSIGKGSSKFLLADPCPLVIFFLGPPIEKQNILFWAQCTLYITYGKSDKSDRNGRRD